jgi:hypothetical protein
MSYTIVYESVYVQASLHYQQTKAFIGVAHSAALPVSRVLGRATCGIVFLAQPRDIPGVEFKVAVKMMYNYQYYTANLRNAFEEEFNSCKNFRITRILFNSTLTLCPRSLNRLKSC